MRWHSFTSVLVAFLCFIVAHTAATKAAENSESNDYHVALEYSYNIDGPFTPLTHVSLTQSLSPRKWGVSLVDQEQDDIPAIPVPSTAHRFYIRALPLSGTHSTRHVNERSSAIASVDTCSLQASNGIYDVAIGLPSDTIDTVAINIFPRQAPDAAASLACLSASNQRNKATTKENAAALRFGRVLNLPIVDAIAIPATFTDKGFPAPGQAEVTDRDILLASGDLPEEERTKLEAQLAAQRTTQQEAPKSLFQQYWHLIVPAMIIWMMLNRGGGASTEGGEGAAAGGTTAAAAAPAR